MNTRTSNSSHFLKHKKQGRGVRDEEFKVRFRSPQSRLGKDILPSLPQLDNDFHVSLLLVQSGWSNSVLTGQLTLADILKGGSGKNRVLLLQKQKKGKFPSDTDGKASACNVADLDLIPGSGRSSGEGNGNLLQYSCLENSMDRGARQAAVHEIAKSGT